MLGKKKKKMRRNLMVQVFLTIFVVEDLPLCLDLSRQICHLSSSRIYIILNIYNNFE